MGIEKTVFISYRRRDELSAVAVFGDLTHHGFDVFIDFDGIASGSFETAILENINARAHFLVVLTPTALERTSNPKDWMRREIETAIDSRRNIVPLILAGFTFSEAVAETKLSHKVELLQQYNGLIIPEGYFTEAMDRLRNKFLSVPVDAVLHPASKRAQQLAEEQKVKAKAAQAAAPQSQTSTAALHIGNCREPDNRAAGLSQNSPAVWTDEQWSLANRLIQEEASRIRVAARILPRVGLLPPDSDGRINDTATKLLATLEVQIPASGEDPESTLRRAADVLARLEDAVVFRGLEPSTGAQGGFTPPGGLTGLPAMWQITAALAARGIWTSDPQLGPGIFIPGDPPSDRSHGLVRAISDAIGRLEQNGQFGPFAAVLGQQLFRVAQTPDASSLVLPRDRIIPALEGGPLLRSPTLDDNTGVVIALGGAPLQLVVATDMTAQLLKTTSDPSSVFRVCETIALRIREPTAIVQLYLKFPDQDRWTERPLR